jgi:chemotaxis protein CheX
MTTPYQIEVHREDIRRFTGEVFRTMLEIETAPAAILADATWRATTPVVIAAVHITGTWKGAVYIECTAEQAFDYTARMMQMDQPTVMSDDVLDVAGEIANMIAGNLKSVLPGANGISTPVVVEGSACTLRICGGNLVDRLAFSSPGGIFWVTLVKVADSTSAAEPAHSAG